jgi:ABC-2 type transport system permease protein
VLEAISDVLPVSYAIDAMQELVGAGDESLVWRNVALVLAFALAGLALGAATLRRRTT